MSAVNISPAAQTQIARELDAELTRQQRTHKFRDDERILYYLAAAFGEGRRRGLLPEQITATAAQFFAGLAVAREKRVKPI